jgi:tetrahydromethanopterin S-methyltransferase subunit B
MLGLVPVLSVIALAIGVVAITGNRSVEEQLSKYTTKIENLNASLTFSKIELEKLKTSIAQEKSFQEEERKKVDEKIEKIIHNLTPLQVKLKMFPTLEDQLRLAAMTSAVVPATASSVPATSAVASVTEKKPTKQVQVMKEAIEKYNKNN